MSYASEVLSDSPIGYWKFNEASGSAIDYGSAAKNLAAGGTPTYGVSGPVVGDTAISLNGTSDYFSVADAGTVFDPGDVFTLEFWVKRAGTTGYQTLWSKGTGSGSPNVFFENTTNLIYLQPHGNPRVLESDSALTDTSSWHHIVITKNGATSVMYLDTADVTNPGTDFTFDGANGSDLNVGRRDANDLFLFGAIAHYAIYGTALSSARVTAHYNAVSDSSEPSPPPFAVASPVRW